MTTAFAATPGSVCFHPYGPPSSTRRSTVRGLGRLALVWGWACLATVTLGQNREPVVTVLADFEDESVAASIAAVRKVVAARKQLAANTKHLADRVGARNQGRIGTVR